jgi:hypothetical protein
MDTAQSYRAKDVGVIQIGILILSIALLCALAADTVWTLPPEVKTVVQVVDTVVCMIFLADV